MQLRNTGVAAAQNVLIELEVVGAEDVVLRKDELLTHPSKLLDDEVQRKRDPNAHVYVDSVVKQRGGGFLVRQRVKSVAVGGREQLVEIGVRGRFDDDGRMRFAVRLGATSQDGSHVSDEFALEVAREEILIDEIELRARFS